MDILKTFERFKLLTPKRGGKFKDDIIAARQASANSSKTHILHERLVISYLGYRARYEASASVREISSATRLHHKSVTKALKSLGAAVVKTKKKWSTTEPPTGWFAERTSGSNPDHWYDKLAYTMFYVPSQGAVVQYKETTRRFGVNHAAVFATIVNQSRQANGVIRNLTISGTAAMLGLCRPTVKAVIDDLIYIRFIEAVDLGSSFDITLMPLTSKLGDYFATKPEPRALAPRKMVPVEKTARPPAYKMQDDAYDDWRNACKKMMPQSCCEEAIATGKELGDCVLAFQDQIRMAKEQHQKNKLNGKVGGGNFGKYFVARMKTRLEEKQRQEREFQADQKKQAYFASEEFRKKQADQEAVAAADPCHVDHEVSNRSIADRVWMAPGAFNEVKAHELVCKILRHCSNQFLGFDLPLDVQRERGDELYRGVMRTALSELNRFYLQEDRATPEMLKSQVDTAFVAKGVQPLFAKSAIKEVSHV